MEAAECSETLTKSCQITESRISQDGNLRNPDTCCIISLLRSKSFSAEAKFLFRKVGVNLKAEMVSKPRSLSPQLGKVIIFRIQEGTL